MLQKVKCFAILIVLALASPSLTGEQPKNLFANDQIFTDPVLTVVQTSSTSVQLSWDAWGESGAYQVTVTNRTASSVEQSTSTGSLTISVNSLTPGHTYRFSVEKNGFVIAEDVVM